MEILIKNEQGYELVSIPVNEIELVKKNNVVVTDFNFSDEDKKRINAGCIISNDMVIIETDEYIGNYNDKVLKDANKIFSDTLKPITGKYTREEIETFAIKLIEAKKVIDLWITSPYLMSIKKDSETLEEFSQRVLNNSESYMYIAGQAEINKNEYLKTYLLID